MLLIDEGKIDGPVSVHKATFDDMVMHYYQDLGRLMEHGGQPNPNQLKQKAFYAFWMRKLKPILFTQPTLPLFAVTIQRG